MGYVADDMQNEAMRWAYDSQVCENGHRYVEDGWGCYTCEMEREEAGEEDEYYIQLAIHYGYLQDQDDI